MTWHNFLLHLDAPLLRLVAGGMGLGVVAGAQYLHWVTRKARR